MRPKFGAAGASLLEYHERGGIIASNAIHSRSSIDLLSRPIHAHGLRLALLCSPMQMLEPRQYPKDVRPQVRARKRPVNAYHLRQQMRKASGTQ